MLERLTIKTDICIEPENEIVYHNPNDPEGMYNILDLAECLYSGGEAEAGILMEISRRLAAYEDSGLSPEEVQKMARAKADGRLVVLPCKVGNTIYRIISYKCNAVCNKLNACNSFIYNACKAEFYICLGTFQFNDIEWIGKTVFLTREEAEKALQEGSE